MSAPRREKSLHATPCRDRVAAVSRACRDMSQSCRGGVAAVSRRVATCRRDVSRTCCAHVALFRAASRRVVRPGLLRTVCAIVPVLCARVVRESAWKRWKAVKTV
eukprot:5760485-Prymnesium_polylepis.2